VLDEPPVRAETDDWTVSPGGTNPGYSPDATVANFVPDSAVPATPFETQNNFSNVISTEQPAYTTEAVVHSPKPQQYASVPPGAVTPHAQRKGSSKALWVVGGLAVLFIFGLAAAGGGWFVYSNYYSAAAVEPTPSPQLIQEVAPTPAPTVEIVSSENTNTSTVELSSTANSNTAVPTVDPTPAPEIQTVKETNPQPRNPNQTQVETRKTTGKTNTGQPTAKPTPKKSDRTVILQ